MLPVNLYLDALKFAASCYITQVLNKETKPLVYDSFKLLPVKRNYNIYKRELITIVKFIKKYFYMFNIKR